MIRRLRYEIRCGRHSGFPACCIVWYCTIWRFFKKADACWSYHRWRDADADYVECPLCKIRGRVPVRVVSCRCRGIR